jgi:hypothetical protein
MQGWVERALLDLQDLFGDLADSEGDAVAVDGAEGHNFQNEHVESALEQIRFLNGHSSS